MFEMRLSPESLAQLLRDVRGFDEELSKALRRRLRAAALPAVQAVKQRVMSAPSHSNGGLRRGIASGVKVSIRTQGRMAGVSIQSTGSGLPGDKKAMVKAFDKPSFRHPVFGNRQTWVTQSGRPYFGTVLNERKASMEEAAEHALRDALQTIRTGVVR